MFFARFLTIVVALNVSQLSPAANYSSEVDRYELITVDIPGARSANFSDLNDRGEGVGTSFTMDGREQTFRWTTSGAQILTTLSGRTESVPPHINNKGAISITGWISPRDRAFRWDQSDGLLDLGTFGWSSYPTAINNRGDVVGYSYTQAGFRHAFIWTEAGGIKDLGTLGGWQSQATGINDHGRVVGWSMLATGLTHGFVWSAETGMKDLGVVPGYQSSFAQGVNKRGDIYGWVESGATYSPGMFFWTDVSGFTRLGPPGIYWSVATGLNDRGEIIGYTKDTPFDNSAFIWTTESGVKRLPTLGGAYTYAASINNHGDIVGFSTDASSIGHSVLWTRKGADWIIYDLGTKCVTRLITDSGLIAGYIDLPPRQLPCLLVRGSMIKPQ
jgi:probable HAF family extracellular repeat protein